MNKEAWKAMRTKKRSVIAVFTLIAIYFAMLISVHEMTRADPEGASVQFISNTTKNSTAADFRNDTKGTINTVLLTTIQQNIKWKAYVGNVSGTLVLRDADDYSIYEWSSGGAPDGEVYITRNDSVDWASIKCANQTSITNEETALGHASSSGDNINHTFDGAYHQEFDVGESTIAISSCKSLATWVNNTIQNFNQTFENSTLFQEVLLMDNSMHVVYAALIDQDTRSYRDDLTNLTSLGSNITYDFQAIIPDYTGVPIARYYFYVEISG